MSDWIDTFWSVLALVGIDRSDLWTVGVPVVWGIMRLAGTTVQSGQHGLKYTFGRASSVVGPGFHGLMPWFQVIVQAPTRSRTLDLPTQRVRMLEGLVYEVNANVTYRVTDLRAALVAVSNLDNGLLDVLAMCVQQVMERTDRVGMRDLRRFDQVLHERLQAQVSAWGVTIDQVGLTTASPLGVSMELVQLGSVVRERLRTLRTLQEQGLPLSRALAVIGTRGGYESRRRRATLREAERRVERRASLKANRMQKLALEVGRAGRVVVVLVLVVALLVAARACL